MGPRYQPRSRLESSCQMNKTASLPDAANSEFDKPGRPSIDCGTDSRTAGSDTKERRNGIRLPALA